MRLRFLTATPMDVHGSGTFMAIATLTRALEGLGHTVRIESPGAFPPVFTLRRWMFNRRLVAARDVDLTVGFDMDGYRVAGCGGRHVAALKGVIADEAVWERGWTRASMLWQAKREREHVLRSALTIVPSEYSAGRVRELYGAACRPAVSPEPIDLAGWRRLFELYSAPRRAARFTVLAVGRLYRRKRVGVLLEAAAALAGRMPRLEVRIVGDGPCGAQLRARARRLGLGGVVRWLGALSQAALAAEYTRADLFCHASVQEGFGIVFLEAMAAGLPIVAARAAAAPEVVPDALLVEPESAEAMAAGIEELEGDPERRQSIAEAGLRRVCRYDAPAVARHFLGTALG